MVPFCLVLLLQLTCLLQNENALRLVVTKSHKLIPQMCWLYVDCLVLCGNRQWGHLPYPKAFAGSLGLTAGTACRHTQHLGWQRRGGHPGDGCMSPDPFRGDLSQPIMQEVCFGKWRSSSRIRKSRRPIRRQNQARLSNTKCRQATVPSWPPAETPGVCLGSHLLPASDRVAKGTLPGNLLKTSSKF